MPGLSRTGSLFGPSIRTLLWAAVGSTLALSFLLYTPQPGAAASSAAWLFESWPALYALAMGMWLLVTGAAASGPALVQKLCKVVLVFLLYSGFVQMLRWTPFWAFVRWLGVQDTKHSMGVLIVLATLLWMIGTVRVLTGFGWRLRLPPFLHFSFGPLGFGFGTAGSAAREKAPTMAVSRPKLRFADVGGMDEAKKQIREIVENRLKAGRFKKYGVVRNGILLYGPRGSGKTFLAEATAGEFGLTYMYVSPTQLTSMWVGSTESNIRAIFTSAAGHRPVLLFIDEIDTLGAARVNLRTGGDMGGSNRGYNDTVIQLMQSIDQHRALPGFILMGATNLLDGLDPALVREGRFDVQIRVDLPDEETRRKIFEAQLAQKPWKRFDLAEFARRTPSASAARIRALVDKAATCAAEDNCRIEERHLRRALDETGGKDRPLFQPVQWEDLVLEPEVEQELRTLVRQLNATWSDVAGLTVPTGVLLVGPAGTGKTMIGRLIATQTRRSFYPLSAADILGGQVGASVKKLQEVFARARESSPSIIFFDEIDGLLPRTSNLLNPHDTQLVEQCRTEISNLLPEHKVFLIGTTNHLDRIDPAILRGGRFSEKIEIGVPGQANRERLLRKYLKPVALDVTIEHLADRLDGLSPADMEAICKAAIRTALGRSDRDDRIPPLIWEDFEKAIKRVQVRL